MISVELLDGDVIPVDTLGLKNIHEPSEEQLASLCNIKYPFRMVGSPISNVVDAEEVRS